MNIYGYVDNKPINRADSLGLESGTVPLGIDPFRQDTGQLPFDPKTGPTPENCAVYPGLLSFLCQDVFPNNPPTNCSRQCLAWSWPGQWNASQNWQQWPHYIYYFIPQHPICWIQCGVRPSDLCPLNNQ
jgi:hypothetical protein